jgi:lipopolysaccharide biosynthesis glycosyltransferase
VSEAIDLACAVEGDYVPHSAAMLLSALDHRGDNHLRIHYMHPPELPVSDRDALARMVEREDGEIRFLEVPDEAVAGFPIEGFTLKATWYRVFLPELVRDATRVIYLDADTVVLDDLAPLWRIELDGRLVGAVTNLHQWDHVGRPAAIGLPAGVEYFNAGVLLLDLERMRDEGTSRELRDFAVANAPRLEWRDQDALNLVLGERRLALAPRWNVMTSILLYPWAAETFGADAVREARQRPAIRHFEGPAINKPWHYLCEHEMREAYLDLRRRTPWPRVRIEGRTAANVARRLSRRLRGRPAVPVPERPGVSP